MVHRTMVHSMSLAGVQATDGLQAMASEIKDH